MPEADLIAEQLRHTLDLVQAQVNALRADQAHSAELAGRRLETLEKQLGDIETRLRAVQEAATQFKFLVMLSAGGGLLSIITLLQTLLER